MRRAAAAAAAARVSPFRLTSLLRLEKDPRRALDLFRNPNPREEHSQADSPNPPPFRHSAASYDVLVCKLGRARMFAEMEDVLDKMRGEPRITAGEGLFCRVITLYGRARLPGAAHRTYHTIPSFRCRRTARSFNTLLHALLHCGEPGAARDLCRAAIESGESPISPDACTYNVLMGSAGSLRDVYDLFDEMLQSGLRPSAATFGTLVAALCSESKKVEAFRLKEAMLKAYGVKPNPHIYTSLMKAACVDGEVDAALELKDEMMLSDPETRLDPAVYSTIIRAMFRAGRKGEVVAMLEEMKGNGITPDTVTYNAMISGFCEEAEFEAAFEVLKEMEREGCRPDIVSYNTIVAGLCKAARWRHAYDLFEDMPRRGCRPDVVTYRLVFDGLLDARELREAALVLEEMMFRESLPRVESLRRFMGDRDAASLAPALFRLAKRSSVESGVWELVIGSCLGESEDAKFRTFVDRLISAG